MNSLTQALEMEALDAEFRFEDADFADARGRAIASSVRRRRAVRAATTGGGSVAAAGGLVVAGLHAPFGPYAAPPGGQCLTVEGVSPLATVSVDGEAQTAVVDGDPRIVTVHRSADAATSDVYVVTITLPDGSELTASPGPDGVRLVTDPSTGETISIERGAGQAPDGAFIYTVRVTGVTGASPSADCDTSSPTPVGEQEPLPTAVAPTTAAPTRLVVRPDLAPSPFDCGFEFALDAGSSERVSIRPKADEDDDGAATVTVTMASELAAGSDPHPAIGWTPGDPAEAVSSGADQDVRGMSFVAVSGGRVVGTLSETTPFASSMALTAEESEVDANWAGIAFTACPDATLADDYQVYAVGGQVIAHAEGTLEGPTYAWRNFGKP